MRFPLCIHFVSDPRENLEEEVAIPTVHTFCEPPEAKKVSLQRRIPLVSHPRAKFRRRRCQPNGSYICVGMPTPRGGDFSVRK